MIVKQFRGRGRRATSVVKPPASSWLFRLYMAWFFNGIDRRKP